MTFNPATIPRPRTWADYAACYSANLVESRDALERALVRFRALRRAGHIAEKPEGGWAVTSREAGNALGDVLRHRSDLDHWHARKVEAEREMRAEAVLDDARLPVEVKRLPPEREPGEEG